jgi:hypothetical protein
MRSYVSILLTFAAAAAFGQSDAKTSFDKLKSLAGVWDGRMHTDPVMKDVEGTSARVTMRVTSMGNAMIHEITSSVRPDDPITMFYIDDGKLLLTHYCDAGNRPRMTAAMTPDGKIDFEFLDVAGPLKYGHMHHGTFTFVDADHHIEDWTYMMPGDKPVHAHVELTRTK